MVLNIYRFDAYIFDINRSNKYCGILWQGVNNVTYVYSFNDCINTDLTAEREECADDLGNVLLLPQVNGLEHINVWDSIIFDGGLEAVN